MIVFDEFSLFITIIFLDNTIRTKSYPLYKIIELLTLVSRRTNCGSQLRVRYVLQKKNSSGDPTKFSEEAE